MESRDTMTCPECGATMNFHAEKIDYSDPTSAVDPDFGGVVEEVHCCPECGATASRPAAPG